MWDRGNRYSYRQLIFQNNGCKDASSNFIYIVTDCRGWKACWWFGCWWVLEPVWRLCAYSPWFTWHSQGRATDCTIQETFLVTTPLLSSNLTSLKLHLARCLVCFPACRINKRNLVPLEAHLLDREMLNSDRSYILDCSTEIFLWMGMTTLVSERKSSVTVLEVSRWNLIIFLSSSITTGVQCLKPIFFHFSRIMCTPRAGHSTFAHLLWQKAMKLLILSCTFSIGPGMLR